MPKEGPFQQIPPPYDPAKDPRYDDPAEVKKMLRRSSKEVPVDFSDPETENIFNTGNPEVRNLAPLDEVLNEKYRKANENKLSRLCGEQEYQERISLERVTRNTSLRRERERKMEESALLEAELQKYWEKFTGAIGTETFIIPANMYSVGKLEGFRKLKRIKAYKIEQNDEQGKLVTLTAPADFLERFALLYQKSSGR